ncbi:MAG: hypothetical protein P8J17_02880 [Halioglobus sp.]|nr:hypothetical protein [Halioglobus sp.]
MTLTAFDKRVNLCKHPIHVTQYWDLGRGAFNERGTADHEEQVHNVGSVGRAGKVFEELARVL